MRVSEFYNLGVTQPELDFVDVDIVGDVKVFVDPRALRLLDSEWGAECRSLLQNFFHTVLNTIRNRDNERAQRLLAVLREPNETHLGLSRERAQGRGLGRELAYAVWEALSQSQAVATGLVEHLEDTVLLVEGIASDIVSDMTTNVIREPLIRYTQAVAEIYGIPLQQVDSGPIWQPHRQSWENRYEGLPVPRSKLLLVPKAIVRRKLDYDPNEYYRVYLLEYLRQEELDANTELVHLLKNGRRRVYTKDLEEKYGKGKRAIISLSRQHPQMLATYRQAKDQRPQPPMEHSDFAEATGSELPDWDLLLHRVTSVSPGSAGSDVYEKAIESLLAVLFASVLMYPEPQTRIHQGRKRIDITYMNAAGEGFFQWLRDSGYFAPYILVECKNYSGDPANPELDQLIGRFSARRGRVGFLVCRKIDDKDLFISRCRDAANDGHGFIIPLDDDDLTELVNEAKTSGSMPAFPYVLTDRFKKLVM